MRAVSGSPSPGEEPGLGAGVGGGQHGIGLKAPWTVQAAV